MKYVKILGLLAVAAAALMAFAASASATTVTTETVGGAIDTTPTIHAVSEGHAVLENSFANIECASTVEGTVSSHGSGVTTVGGISTLTFTGCTNGWTVTVNAPGSLEIHWTSGSNGTLTSSGATVTAVLHTFFGDVTCRYSTNNTHIGTVTGGSPSATLHIEGSIPFHSGGGLCGEGASRWTGSYTTTRPLVVDP
jgi:hypothetical protein